MKKIKLLVLLIGLTCAMVSCKDDHHKLHEEYVTAQTQLMSDYSDYEIGNVSWFNQGSYVMGQFNAETDTSSMFITAWYSVNNSKATRQMDHQFLGTNIPSDLTGGYYMSKYSDTDSWELEAATLENNYNGNGIDSYYAMHFQNINNPDIFAEAYFDTSDYIMIFNDEWNDEIYATDNNLKLVINSSMVAAVKSQFANTEILDATLSVQPNGSFIAINAVQDSSNTFTQLSIALTLAYNIYSVSEKQQMNYNELPSGFSSITDWFTANSSYPMPPSETQVTLITGKDESVINDIEYNYAVEFDDYSTTGTEYYLQFFLDSDYNILGVASNGELLE